MTQAQALATKLLAWYAEYRRDLPWRSPPGQSPPPPYHVLLSELMLQQTRVETVKPYYARFLERWPKVEDLAAAELEDVLKEWAGLGYYSRAKNLHRAAQATVDQGGFPRTADALRDLPGVGEYTAGAVASIAFGQPAPAVDGNVERVLSRVHGLPDDPRRAAGKRALRARAQALLDASPTEAAHLNQALMELGATVCTPRGWRCGRCPWRQGCVARAEGRVAELPNRPPRKKPVPIRGVAGVLRGPEGVLLGRRGPGLLAGLWEPPSRFGHHLDDGPAILALMADLGLQVEIASVLGSVQHVFTHRRLTLQVFALRFMGGSPRPGTGHDAVAWHDDLGQVGLSALAAKVLALRQPQLFGPG